MPLSLDTSFSWGVYIFPWQLQILAFHLLDIPVSWHLLSWNLCRNAKISLGMSFSWLVTLASPCRGTFGTLVLAAWPVSLDSLDRPFSGHWFLLKSLSLSIFLSRRRFLPLNLFIFLWHTFVLSFERITPISISFARCITSLCLDAGRAEQPLDGKPYDQLWEDSRRKFKSVSLQRKITMDKLG